MKRLTDYIYKVTGSNPNKSLADTIIPSFFIQISSVTVLFTVNFLLARLMSTAEYGVYSFAFSFATLIGTIATCGFTLLLVREIPAYKVNSDWAKIKGLAGWAKKWVLIVSILASVVCFSIFFFFPQTMKETQYAYWVALSMITIPFISFILIHQSVLNGIHEISRSQIAEKLLRPLILLILVGALWLVYGNTLPIKEVIYINLLSFIVATLVTIFFIRKKFTPLVSGITQQLDLTKWKKGLFYFLVLMGVGMINTRIDIVILGFMRKPEEVGIYNVAVKLSEFIAFAFYVVSFTLNPTISKLYASGEMEKLQHVVTKSIRIVLLAALPLTLLFVFAGEWLLNFWGSDYTLGYKALFILSINQLVNVITGPVGGILVMTGHEKKVVICTCISASISVVLNLFLIPLYGIEGAAISSTVALIVWNVTMVFLAKKYTGIRCTVF